jgi:hypothetical protein
MMPQDFEELDHCDHGNFISLCVPQNRELAVYSVITEQFQCRLAYSRAQETRIDDDLGQDYITIRYNDECIVFVVCDGVSQSFFGNLAATFLGDNLVRWLWEMPSSCQSKTDVLDFLEQHLEDAIVPATELINQKAISNDLPEMLQQVLEDKRAKGSETTFSCCRIDWPTDGRFGRITLASMGDTRVQLWENGTKLVNIDNLDDNLSFNYHWSSLRGVGSRVPLVQVGSIIERPDSAVHVLIYSDGLHLLDDRRSSLSNDQLNKLIQESSLLPTSDDISLVEVCCKDVSFKSNHG